MKFKLKRLTRMQEIRKKLEREGHSTEEIDGMEDAYWDAKLHGRLEEGK